MTPYSFEIEKFDPSKVSYWALINVFYRSVHALPEAMYSPEQKSAWAPDGIDRAAWQARIEQHNVWVAVDRNNHECLGFIELDQTADLECLYVCPTAQKQGIAKSLLSCAQQHVATMKPEKKAWLVRASDAAYEFFIRHGFMPTERNVIERFGVTLHNTTMSKAL
ncbi:GNAT family N-acetyltransferase [Marinomonas ostreistagni]|uniref:GNAT family N-acetyltransferase n=1 Tax=Marinomonas ostreistagni TaxID=359209 RepID=UPI001951B07A|nr:GNAT family N-acetyltransferase [Marinomonas ostreistagni]MBM6551705.1 GNAT family N-acetyltransferase [Marinomonas ostreistagni]